MRSRRHPAHLGGSDACALRSDGRTPSRRLLYPAPCYVVRGLWLNCYKDFTVLRGSSYKLGAGSHLESSGPDLSPHPPTTRRGWGRTFFLVLSPSIATDYPRESNYGLHSRHECAR